MRASGWQPSPCISQGRWRGSWEGLALSTWDVRKGDICLQLGGPSQLCALVPRNGGVLLEPATPRTVPCPDALIRRDLPCVLHCATAQPSASMAIWKTGSICSHLLRFTWRQTVMCIQGRKGSFMELSFHVGTPHHTGTHTTSSPVTVWHGWDKGPNGDWDRLPPLRAAGWGNGGGQGRSPVSRESNP